MPFRFLKDIATADVAFESWGNTREELFRSCAEALLRTMVEKVEDVGRNREARIHLEREELDLLLFAFLNELLFLKDARRLLLHVDKVEIAERDGLFTLEVVASGEEINSERHRFLVDVKAVTMHRFRVVREGDLWKAVVVLDV